jgi:hypothetical protein
MSGAGVQHVCSRAYRTFSATSADSPIHLWLAPNVNFISTADINSKYPGAKMKSETAAVIITVARAVVQFVRTGL